MTTIALVVFIFAIAVFFAKEFSNIIKKIMAIPGMKLVLPLLLATLFIVFFQPEAFWCLTKIQFFVLTIRDKIAGLLAFKALGVYLASLITLMGLTFLPVAAINYWYQRKTFHGYLYTELTLALIWIFIALMLVLVS